MLTIIYDAQEGVPYRDGELQAYIDYIVPTVVAAPDNDYPLAIATDNILNALRVEIKEKRLPLELVKLIYRTYSAPGEDGARYVNDEELKIYPNAGIRPWPKGFADRVVYYLMKLL